MSSTVNDVPLVAPVLALAGWTYVMQIWLYSYRIPDITRYKVKIGPNISKSELEKAIPRHRQFPSDNFAHLHEQPTVFYAVALGMAVLGVRDRTSLGLAWGYVGARVVHSLVQATTNVIWMRFQVFALSSVLLVTLTVRGALAAW